MVYQKRLIVVREGFKRADRDYDPENERIMHMLYSHRSKSAYVFRTNSLLLTSETSNYHHVGSAAPIVQSH